MKRSAVKFGNMARWIGAKVESSFSRPSRQHLVEHRSVLEDVNFHNAVKYTFKREKEGGAML